MSALDVAVICLHAGCTWAMAGLIWFVQVVHYPLMARVSPDRFRDYHHAHMQRTTWVVAPLMVAEALSGIWLLAAHLVPATLGWAGLVLIALLWAATFLVSVPRHERLTRGLDPHMASSLVATNWLRTLLWSLRAVLVAAMLFAALRVPPQP